jgi:3-oxoacyl-[acyl-carrier-protein] synthase II
LSTTSLSDAQRVVVTGMGMITPVGHTVAETWHSVTHGVCGIDTIKQFDPGHIDVKIAAEVKDFDPTTHFGNKEARRLDRVSQFALIATRQAMEDSGLKITEDTAWDTAVVVGSGIGGINTLTAEHNVMVHKGPKRVSPFTVPMMLPDTATGQIAIHFGVRGPNICVVTACASGVNALGEAFEMIRAGRCSAAIAGGAEAAINDFSLSAFWNMGALSGYNDTPQTASRPFDKTRNGFVSSEGAGMFVLESLAHARARGARIHAEIVGYGCTDDAFHITAPTAEGPAMAMKIAMRQAGINPGEIDYINAHATSTPLSDANETKALKRVFGEQAYDVSISGTKSMTGHALGAIGAVEAGFCIKAIQDGVIPPTINLINPDPDCDLNYTPNHAVHKTVRTALTNSFGFGGHNASLILKAYA